MCCLLLGVRWRYLEASCVFICNVLLFSRVEQNVSCCDRYLDSQVLWCYTVTLRRALLLSAMLRYIGQEGFAPWLEIGVLAVSSYC